MYLVAFVFKRPSVDIPFFDASHRAEQDAYIAAKVAFPNYVNGYFKVSADKLTYTRLDIYAAHDDFIAWEATIPTTPALASFKSLLDTYNATNAISMERFTGLDQTAAEAEILSAVQVDKTKSLVDCVTPYL